jgi:hypothetical protein
MSNKDLGKVIAIQVAPWKYVADGSPEGSIEIQMEGADQETKGYGIYTRHENGMAVHNRDYETEAAAVREAKIISKELGVKVEPYGWQVCLVHMGPDIVVDDSQAFEAFALRQNFIKDVQRYDFKHPDKHKAGKYGHYDTANARVIWDGAVAWTVAVMGHLGMSRDYLNGGDVRVVVEGRTGVGKSALCGIIAEKMKALGIHVTWNEQEYESNRQDRPWEVELQELLVGGTVRIVERNLVPSRMPKEFEFKAAEIKHRGDKHYFALIDEKKPSTNAIKGEVIGIRYSEMQQATEYTVKWETGETITHRYGNTPDNLAFLRTGILVYTDNPNNPSYITPGPVIRQADTHDGVKLKPEIYPGPDGEQQ